MPTGSGIDGQFGTVTETTVGTQVTPVTKFFAFDSSSLAFDPSYLEGHGIIAGQRFRDVGAAGIVRKQATGKVEIPVMNKGFGWWAKHILGSTANPAVIATTAFKQIHVPGGLRGLSFTSQVGKPEPHTGTIKPQTYRGCKVTDWELTIADNELTMLSVTIDAWDEDGAPGLSTAVYPSAALAFNFSHVTTFKVGGTPSFGAGEVSIAAGVTVPSVVTKMTISGKASLETERFGLGNAGIKREQLESDFFEITGSFEGEYDSTIWDSPFRLGTTVALQCDSTFGDAGSANPYLLGLIVPFAKITKAPAEISGPGLVSVSGEFKAYADPSQPTIAPFQMKLVSTDSAAW